MQHTYFNAIMATFTLQGNIIELVCRTCLKNSEVKFNIFQHFQKNKLISDLIMECTPIKLQNDDGYPVNICNNCMDNLTSTCDFITMVVESDVKLKSFCKNNIRGQALPNDNIKAPNIKNEEIEATHNSITFNSIENSNLINGEDKYSLNDVGNPNPLDCQNILAERENVSEPLYSSDIEEKSMVSTCEISNESSEACHEGQTNGCLDNFCIKSDNQVAHDNAENIKAKSDKICGKLSLKQCEKDSGKIIIKCEEGLTEVSRSTEKESSHRSLSRIKPCDQCTVDRKLKINRLNKKPKCSTKTNVNEKQAELVDNPDFKPCDQCTVDRKLKINRLNKKPKRSTKTNVNEKQAELVDNPDFKRIMAMNLSKKEKNRQTIFCKECNKTLTFAYFLDTHIHLHTGNLPFKCDKCGKSYPKRSLLNKHLHRHETDRNFSCEECGKAFRTIHILKQHKLVHSSEKPYRCDICGKALKYAPSLSTHMKIHKNEKNHVCEICGKAFVDYNILRVHIMRHTVSEKKFECKICGKKYGLKKDLDSHEHVHSNERPHVCKQCGKSFQSREVWKQHQLIHTGEKPHACKVCGKRFRQRGCIPRHMRVHTGETPFPCNLCNSAFKYKHHLQHHMKAHQK